MPRKLRLEYDGAVYHVINRGNYRADVFSQDATKAAFLNCLNEACEKSGWVVHAWCVMSNHYHLCLETPTPNLVEGMKWLQATFALRFNRFRNERGHLFQGRYKALIVDPESIGAVCHYIHLNPVRAGITDTAALPAWPWSSIAHLMNPRHRPAWFSPQEALAHAGGLADTPAGRKRYLAYLTLLQEDDHGKRALEFERLSKGWAIGTRAFKLDLVKAHKQLASATERETHGPREFAQELWEENIQVLLKALGKGNRDIRDDPKGSPWKVAVASKMKSTSTASNPWLAKRLNMGSPFRLSRLAGECRAHPRDFEPFAGIIAKCKV